MHIPKELIEQLSDREFEVDDWYKYLEAISVRMTPTGPELNPLSYLFVIADEGNKVVGMLWAEVDVLGKTLVIQNFSMDRAYWVRGQAVELLAKKGKELAKELELKKIAWITRYPRHSEKHGFRRARDVLMEWTEEDCGKNFNGICPAQGQCSDADRRTAERPEPDAPGCGSPGAAVPDGALARV